MKTNGPDPIDVHVGLTMRRFRKELSLSQTALAEAMGVHFQQIRNYEKGKNRVSASMLVRAAAILGVAAADLLPQAGETPEPVRVQRLALVRGVDELVAAYSEISSIRHRRTVLQLARVLASGSVRNDAAE